MAAEMTVRERDEAYVWRVAHTVDPVMSEVIQDMYFGITVVSRYTRDPRPTARLVVEEGSWLKDKLAKLAAPEGQGEA